MSASGGFGGTRSAVHTASAPAAVGPYSQAIVAGGMVFASGQIGLDPGTGKLVDGGVEAQARRALDNLGQVLAAAGSSWEGIAKTTLFLADMADFAAVNAVYAERFEGAPPARSTVAVSGLPLGALVEVEAIALVGG